MDPIADYLAERVKAPITSVTEFVQALDTLSLAGREIDATLVRAERAKALASRSDVSRLEQTVQTLGALSREVWIAHTATLTTINALKQLAEVEAALAG